MPIYSYRCEQCGHQQDVLQKMSDPLLVTCPACGQPAYRKQVTAAGFQLKGSGWYVTDFRNPAAKEAAKGVPKADDAGGAKESASAADSSGTADTQKADPAATRDATREAPTEATRKPTSGATGDAKSTTAPAAAKPAADSGGTS